MNKLELGLSRKIANMSVICMLLVVCIHVWVPMKEDNFAYWTRRLFGGTLGSVAVPFFFAVSGYFLARHADEDGWWGDALRRRMRTLLLPFLIWCALWVFMESCGVIIHNVMTHQQIFAGLDFSGRFWASAFGLNLYRPPAAPAFWYVRALLIFVFASPLLMCVRGRWPLVIVFIVYVWLKSFFAYWSAWGQLFYFGISVEGLFYFLLGIRFCRQNTLPPQVSRLGRCGVTVVSLVLCALVLCNVNVQLGYVLRACFILTTLWAISRACLPFN